MANTDRLAVELLLDASGSMTATYNGSTRIEAAKKILKEIVEHKLSDGLQVALRVFGAQGGCDTDLLVPLGALDRNSLSRTIAGVQASGNTAIATALDRSAQDLASATGPKHVVLLTDGEESCGGNVEDSLRKLSAKDGFQFDVVGLNTQLHTTFATWAEAGGGTHFPGTDHKKLLAALAATWSVGAWNADFSGPIRITTRLAGEHEVDVDDRGTNLEITLELMKVSKLPMKVANLDVKLYFNFDNILLDGIGDTKQKTDADATPLHLVKKKDEVALEVGVPLKKTVEIKTGAFAVERGENPEATQDSATPGRKDIEAVITYDLIPDQTDAEEEIVAEDLTLQFVVAKD